PPPTLHSFPTRRSSDLHDPNMLDHNIIWKATEGKGGGSYNMPPHGGWGITVDGSDETVIAHNLIGYTQDAGVKLRTIESRIVGSDRKSTRLNSSHRTIS